MRAAAYAKALPVSDPERLVDVDPLHEPRGSIGGSR
ncbi:hypothetical protein DFR50_102115 [Roseiarcus fermentans]|uniref:Uncharacterized protein n=1 Tax=Roseiarcus fermentans TaxID=1473586 RepID=A0A366FSH0_9HYPH|nr:hypothetical protein DFR50_102115 [Roseiarcus fermentans]